MAFSQGGTHVLDRGAQAGGTNHQPKKIISSLEIDPKKFLLPYTPKKITKKTLFVNLLGERIHSTDTCIQYYTLFTSKIPNLHHLLV